MNPFDRLAESARVDQLTLTEAAIVCGWAEGLEHAEVGQRLGLSVNTVKEMGKRIRGKLGVHTKAGAVGAWTRYAG